MEDERLKKITEVLSIFGKTRCFPSRALHARRNDFNVVPSSMSTLLETDRRKGKHLIYIDSETGTHWVRQPWYLTMFHKPWRNYKFLAYDNDINPSARGSSEIIIPKRAKSVLDTDQRECFDCSKIKTGSYNFRSYGLAHYVADVLPVVLYCNRV